MKLLIIVGISLVALIVVLVAVMALIGSRLPKDHVVSRSILLQKAPAEIYAVMRDFSSAPRWRSDLKSIEVTQGSNGRVQFRENGKHGAVNYELEEDVPGQRMVTRILDTNLGYSGKWTYVIATEAGGTRLTITENGEVSNLIFRFMSRYVFGQTSTIETYLTSLAKHFGESAQPK